MNTYTKLREMVASGPDKLAEHGWQEKSQHDEHYKTYVHHLRPMEKIIRHFDGRWEHRDDKGLVSNKGQSSASMNAHLDFTHRKIITPPINPAATHTSQIPPTQTEIP